MEVEVSSDQDDRVLILPPTRRDGRAMQALFGRAQIACELCENAQALATQLAQGAGSILLADTVFADANVDQLLSALSNQPEWSDIPIVLLCRAGYQSQAVTRFAEAAHNVTLLERPSTSQVLVSSLRAALRARRRQYELRDQLNLVRMRARQLRTITDNTPDVISRFDRQLRHVFVNKAATRITGIAQDAFIGRTHRELGMSESLCEQLEQALREVFLSGRPQTIESEYEGVSGVRHFVDALIPELDEIGAVETVLCVSHDITDRRQADMALQVANRRKDEFLAMLAHELRNPLAPILNASELLTRTLPSNEGAKKAAAIIWRQVTHMTRLVDDLLDIARITEGRIELHSEPVELAAVIEEAVESVEPLILEKRHTLSVEASNEMLRVTGDHARLVQCISNVLTNAAKYTDPNGVIRLEAQRWDGAAVITVSDNGVGISADLLPRLFDLFVQGARSLDRSQGGLGIGLSLVKRLIEMQGGSVSVRSEGPGRGSIVEMRVPLSPLQ